MISLTTYITEALKVSKSTAVDKLLDIKDVPYTKTAPDKNKAKEYLQIQPGGKTWKDIGDDVYVKLEDINDKSEKYVLSLAYSIMKQTYPSGNHADINFWDEKEGQWSTFASAWLQTKNRMWHPEWTDGIFDEK